VFGIGTPSSSVHFGGANKIDTKLDVESARER